MKICKVTITANESTFSPTLKDSITLWYNKLPTQERILQDVEQEFTSQKYLTDEQTIRWFHNIIRTVKFNPIEQHIASPYTINWIDVRKT